MAVADLAAQGPNACESLTSIGTRQSISVTFLEQLFGKLRRAGIVESIRGAQGGYRLTQDAAVMSLDRIIHAVDASPKAHGCTPEAKIACTGKTDRCLTHDLWGALENRCRWAFACDGIGGGGMRGILTFVFAATVLPACQTVTEEPNFHPPISSEWELVEMQGLDAAYRQALGFDDKPISITENISNLRLVTRDYWFGPLPFEVVKFSGCQGVVSIDLTSEEVSPYGKNWRIFGEDFCRNLDSLIGISQDHAARYGSAENFRFYRVAEAQFIKLVKDVEDHEIDFVGPDVLDLLDENGMSLMKFKQREAAE